MPAGLPVKRPLPAFGFYDRTPELIALPFLAKGVGAGLCVLVFEQQAVWNIVTAARGEILVPKGLRPTEAGQDFPYQVIFSLAFVRRLRRREAIEK
ncbi:MAG: hypothetical protein ACREDD_04445, partial [Methylocella sp.]